MYERENENTMNGLKNIVGWGGEVGMDFDNVSLFKDGNHIFSHWGGYFDQTSLPQGEDFNAEYLES